MPVIEEVEEEPSSKHTTVQMGAASRMRAFAEEGGIGAFAEAQEQGAADGDGPPECSAPTSRSRPGPESADVGGEDRDQGVEPTVQQEEALTEEQKAEHEEMLTRARTLKEEGNALFGSYEYDAAIQKYTEAIAAAPSDHHDRAVFLNNRATCYFKQGNYGLVIADCTAALKIDPNYSKCLLRRAQAYETEKKVCEAFDDFERILKLDPSNSMAAAGSKRLKPAADAERERMKEEMMGKLKDLGNSVLGHFGMSLDNFKAEKDPNTGSYNISFQR